MMNFLQKFWKVITYIRTGLLNAVFLLVLAAIVVSIMMTPGQAPMHDQAPLTVKLSGILVDQLTHAPSALDLLESENPNDNETLLRDVITAINHARDDERITALILDLGKFSGGGLSKMEELGQALDNFKQSDKAIIAYADNYSQQQYFIASYADTVYLHALGSVGITGFGVYRNYFKDASDKIALKFHIFRVGEYKDAVEPLIRNSMSDSSREHNSLWLNALWQRYTAHIEKARSLKEGSIDKALATIDQDLAESKDSLAQWAKKVGLVDEILSRTEFNEKMIAQFGSEEEVQLFKSIALKEYSKTVLAAKTINDLQNTQKEGIGLIVATGTIVEGNGQPGEIGGNSLSSLIRKAVNDDQLKALIIRIDSGGGSAFASEVIRNELQAAIDKGLEIYISMGSVAASGGYWIATASAEIWATPSTITGSIGVFGLLPNVSESLSKLGIHTDGIGTSKLADMYRPDRKLSQSAQRVIQSSVDNIYREFLRIVADARESDADSIHEIAQGRVWTGEKALQLGLVDHLGSLSDLVDAIKEKHQLADANLQLIERELSPKEVFMKILAEETRHIGEQVRIAVMGKSLNQASKAFEATDMFSVYTEISDATKVDIMASCFICAPL
ncbi:MAG: signal peptide peptidase SppA [Alteromonadaceae bacterium]|nr:MAG: signal peptide peptidase SppA [Alteromonadaceae bacterium]